MELDARLLTIVTFLPLATGLVLLPLRSLPETVWKVVALASTTLTFLLSLALWPKILSRAARIQASTPLS